MRPSRPHPFLRPHLLNSYTAYSVGCAIAWAAVWAIVVAVDPKSTIDHVGWVFGGWVVGRASATIARVVYPPPKQRASTGPSSFFQGFRNSERHEGRLR